MISNKIKILHLVASRGIGGAERVLLTLSKNIDRRKFDLILGIFIEQRKSENPFWQEAKELNFPLEPIEYKNPYNIMQIMQICGILKKHHPDIIHTHGYKTNILGVLAAKPYEIPTVTTIHGLYPMQRKSLVWLSLRILRYFNRIIVVSDQIKGELKILNVPSEKMVTIRNVSPIRYDEKSVIPGTFRKEIGIPSDVKVIGFVGRLEPVKACSEFIKIIPHVAKSRLDTYFVVVGDGSERESLESLVKELGIENRIHFAGFRKDTINILQSLDLCVLPSLNEGIPLALLEAMTQGVPVIATRVGGIPEVIKDKVNGILVAPKDPKGLVESILESLNNPKETRKLVLEAKKTIIGEYNIEKWVERIQNLYLEMSQKNSPLRDKSDIR